MGLIGPGFCGRVTFGRRGGGCEPEMVGRAAGGGTAGRGGGVVGEVGEIGPEEGEGELVSTFNILEGVVGDPEGGLRDPLSLRAIILSFSV